MPESYHASAGSVKSPAPKTVKSAVKERTPATFTPYFHQAYNEIVNPRRFDHYFVQKWMRLLGPVAFAIVKALRDLCYHNPSTGVLRDSIELTIEELAGVVGVSPSTLKRELAHNETLALFVQREKQYMSVGGVVVRKANRWRVSMDEPIHPDDRDRYESLLQGETPVESRRVQIDPDRKKAGSRTGQNDPNNKGQIEPHYKGQNDPVNNSLPSGGLITKETNTPAAGTPPINPPQGEDAGKEPAPVVFTGWEEAQPLMRRCFGAMTYNCKVKRLELLEESDTGVRLRAPDAVCAAWAAKEETPLLLARLLSECYGREITVQFV
jgi:AraC-like DNA-binding protein